MPTSQPGSPSPINEDPVEVALTDCRLDPAKEAAMPKVYRAGTLNYTFRGLVVLSLWLLWGDFAFTFFESVFSRFMPIYLRDLQASNTLIGVMTGSIAGMVNILFLPNISQWSDNYRSRIGRRIPFLDVIAPLTVASLIAIGFAPEIAGWLRAHLPLSFTSAVPKTTVVLVLMCAFVVSFHFFNMVLINTYNWLLRDVVPQELMARFLSWFRVVGTVSSCGFLWFVFPHVVAYRKEVFLAVGLFYLVAFLLMCFNVKEGDYPPPPLREEVRHGIFKSFARYFRDCLSLPIYRNFFIAYVLGAVASSCAAPFYTLFARETLGVDMDGLGKILAGGSAAAALAFLPMGWLCDKFSPLQVMLGALVGQVIGGLAAYFLVTSQAALLIYTLVFSIPIVAWSLGTFAATMKLFPKENFGQFSSGLNVFGCGVLILGNYLIGRFMDLAHSNYRMTYLWSATLFAAAIYPLFLVYGEWKRHGGPHHYVPPLPPESRSNSSQ